MPINAAFLSRKVPIPYLMSSPVAVNPAVEISTGAQFPALGLGTYVGPGGGNREEVKQSILEAIKVGYRHIDTAMIYLTEPAVGDAIRESGVPREEFFVVTKLWNLHHRDVQKALDVSLKNLGLDYVDLYLMHWPITYEFSGDYNSRVNPDGTLVDGPPWSFADAHYHVDRSWSFVQTWKDMEKIPKNKARAIGVSNFSLKTFNELLKSATTVPAVNQVEIHPYLQQHSLRAYCKQRNIVLTAYSPLGSGNISCLQEPAIQGIASKHECTPAQVILSWIIGLGDTVIMRSTKIQRLKDNFKTIKLDSEDVSAIAKLDRNQRLAVGVDPNDSVFGWSFEELGWDK